MLAGTLTVGRLVLDSGTKVIAGGAHPSAVSCPLPFCDVSATQKPHRSNRPKKRAILPRVQLLSRRLWGGAPKRALTLIAWLAAAFAACTRVESAGAPPDVSVGANGFGGEADGGSGSRGGEAG